MFEGLQPTQLLTAARREKEEAAIKAAAASQPLAACRTAGQRRAQQVGCPAAADGGMRDAVSESGARPVLHGFCRAMYIEAQVVLPELVQFLLNIQQESSHGSTACLVIAMVNGPSCQPRPTKIKSTCLLPDVVKAKAAGGRRQASRRDAATLAVARGAVPRHGRFGACLIIFILPALRFTVCFRLSAGASTHVADCVLLYWGLGAGLVCAAQTRPACCRQSACIHNADNTCVGATNSMGMMKSVLC